MAAQVMDHALPPRVSVKRGGGAANGPEKRRDVPEVLGLRGKVGSEGGELDLDIGKRGAVGVGCPKVAVLFPVASGKVFL